MRVSWDLPSPPDHRIEQALLQRRGSEGRAEWEDVPDTAHESILISAEVSLESIDQVINFRVLLRTRRTAGASGAEDKEFAHVFRMARASGNPSCALAFVQVAAVHVPELRAEAAAVVVELRAC